MRTVARIGAVTSSTKAKSWLDPRRVFDAKHKPLLGSHVAFRNVAELPLRRRTEIFHHSPDGFLVAAIQRVGWTHWRGRVGRTAASSVCAGRKLAARITLPAYRHSCRCSREIRNNRTTIRTDRRSLSVHQPVAAGCEGNRRRRRSVRYRQPEPYQHDECRVPMGHESGRLLNDLRRGNRVGRVP
jgi:hypothetical protein